MQAKQFVYDRFAIVDNRTLQFYYRLIFENDEVEFCESWQLPTDIPDSQDKTLQFILRQLHLGVGISYFKAYVPPVVTPYELSEQEASYWNTVYGDGLGEFSYTNQIIEPIKPFTATTSAEHAAQTLDTSKAVLGLGGGKDSIVAGELLKQTGTIPATFVLTTGDNHGQTDQVAATMHTTSLEIKRFLDKKIIDVTKTRDGYNGHVPISMLFSWAGVLLAYLDSYRYVVVANEAAANIGNVEWRGRTINHQWSKSLEFEKLMQDYVHTHVSPDITYTSVIRQFGSLAVAKLFAQLAIPYLDKFTSCNLVFRIDPAMRPNGRWCGHCAKCLSSYILLATFLTPDQMTTVFGQNLLDNMELQTTFHELLGLTGNKPMDCVGTIEEMRACVRQLIDQGDTSQLLTTIKYTDLGGPSLQTLIHQRYPHLIPSDLHSDLESVTRSLGL